MPSNLRVRGSAPGCCIASSSGVNRQVRLTCLDPFFTREAGDGAIGRCAGRALQQARGFAMTIGFRQCRAHEQPRRRKRRRHLHRALELRGGAIELRLLIELEAFQERGQHLIAFAESGHGGAAEVAGARFLHRGFRSGGPAFHCREDRRQRGRATVIPSDRNSITRRAARSPFRSAARRPMPARRRRRRRRWRERCGTGAAGGRGPCCPAEWCHARDSAPAAAPWC